jgi:hypothetical protein
MAKVQFASLLPEAGLIKHPQKIAAHTAIEQVRPKRIVAIHRVRQVRGAVAKQEREQAPPEPPSPSTALQAGGMRPRSWSTLRDGGRARLHVRTGHLQFDLFT